MQQLRETFAEAGPYRYAILDHDSIFNKDVIAFLEATGLTAKRTSIHAPWQNGTAERWTEAAAARSSTISFRSTKNTSAALSASMSAITEDLVHDSLSKDAPCGRPIESGQPAMPV